MHLLDDILFPRINDLALGEATSPLRAEVAGGARGKTLEIGAGTGLNFRHYPEAAAVIAIEPAAGMHERAARGPARPRCARRSRCATRTPCGCPSPTRISTRWSRASCSAR